MTTPKTVTMTQADLKKAIKESTESAVQATMAKYEKVIAELEAKIPAVVESPVVETPAIEGSIIRDEFVKCRNAYFAIQAEYMRILKSGTKEQKENIKKTYDEKLALLKEMSSNMAIREHIADFFHNSADNTRKHGHKAVDTIAKGLHKSVDGIAVSLDYIGCKFETKEKVVLIKA